MSSFPATPDSEPADRTRLPNHWQVDLLRGMLGAVAAEDAVSLAATAWLAVGDASSATAILFVSSTKYVAASARRSSGGEIDVSVTSGQESLSVLFSEDRLAGLTTSTLVSSSRQVCRWPESLSGCVVDWNSRVPQQSLAQDVAARILSQAESRQIRLPSAEHLEALAEFAAGAGHEINNPLGSIVGQSQLLLKQELEPDRRQALGTIGSQAFRIRDMIGDCMLFARPPAPERQTVSPAELLSEAATKAVEAMEQSQHCVRFELPAAELEVSLDATQIRTLISHLVRNALEAAVGADQEPEVTVGMDFDADAVIFTVEDRGPGIQGNDQRHLFDPFYSGRQAGRGLGFGLPVAWQIARNHNGVLLHETPGQGGARFVVVLPRQ